MEEAKKIVVFTCCDEHFVDHMCVTMFSMAKKLEQGFHVALYVFHDNVSEGKRGKATQLLRGFGVFSRITWIQPDLGPFEDVVVRQHVSRVSRFRLAAPDLIEESGMAIYLDSDLLVRKSIHEISAVCGGDVEHLAAVRNFSQPFHPDRSEYGLPDWSASRLPYFNAGVLVINLDNWRKLSVGPTALELLSRKDVHGRSITDQIVLNYLFQGKWKCLDFRWNQSVMAYRIDADTDPGFWAEVEPQLDALLNDPYIVHFNGSSKPWNNKCPHPFAGEYVRLRLASKVDHLGERSRLRFQQMFSGVREKFKQRLRRTHP